MHNQLSIIIPTHERHHVLKRAVDYYQYWSVNVIVVDSSKVPVNFELPSNVTYLHFDKLGFGEKIYKALSDVTTPYVSLCADDDFLAANGISCGLDFLQKNQDFISVQGHSTSFYYLDGSVKNLPRYTKVIGYNISDVKPADRIRKAFNPYMHHFYSLFRTEILKRSFQVTCSIEYSRAVELSIPLVSLCYGKHLMLPVYWLARDANDYKSISASDLVNKTNIVTEWSEFITSSECDAWYNSFNDVVLDVLSDKQHTREIFDIFLSAYNKNINVAGNFKRAFTFKFVVKMISPNWLLNKYHSMKYSEVMFSNVPGFPWSDSKAKKDWTEIEAIIVKHGNLLKTKEC